MLLGTTKTLEILSNRFGRRSYPTVNITWESPMHIPAMASSQFHCHTCRRSFTRSEHLERHLISHTGSRAFQCQFCSVRFNRRDALVRHWRTCKERLSAGQGIPELSQQKRGRKQNACDRCAQRKRGCSQTFPCDTCIEQSQECTYLRLRQDPRVEHHHRHDEMLAPLHVDETLSSPTISEIGVNASQTWEDAPRAEPVNQDSRGGITKVQANNIDLQADAMLPFLDIPASSVMEPVSPKLLDPQPKLWPMAIPWSLDITSFYGPSFASQIRPKLTFLARFTSTNGMANSFDCGNSEERKRIMATLMQFRNPKSVMEAGLQQDFELQSALIDFDIGLQPSHDLGLAICPPAWSVHVQSAELVNGLGFQPSDNTHDWVAHRLSQKTQEIIMGIREVIQHKQRKSPIKITWSQPREMMCYRFFSPQNLERFLEAFWAMWYPNWPVFHKPTFIATNKPAPLLAAMATIGASLTSEKTDRDQAMVWADAIEELVFTDDAFCESDIPQTDDEFEEFNIETRLNSLRAAYAVVLLLTWEGLLDQKKRARRTRFSQIIAVARSFRFSSATHKNLGTHTRSNDHLQNWKSFILREELIRTLNYVFNLDCAFVMFNNCAPRMATLELQFNMACPEACFQAETPKIWYRCMAIWSSSQIGIRQPLLSDVIEMITVSQPSDEDWVMLQQMSSMNFFTLANAFHNLIFHHHCGPAHSTENSSITQALRNWKRLWISRQPIVNLIELHQVEPCDAWKRIGFIKYAEEFWRLAYSIYKHPQYMQTLKLDGKKCAGASWRTIFLNSFDDSNMGQVHDLIILFQDLNFAGEDFAIR